MSMMLNSTYNYKYYIIELKRFKDKLTKIIPDLEYR